jgi:hypothetical protein
MMKTDLETLIQKARGVTMTNSQRETQRRSFAFGNTHIENERVTREHIADAAAKISAQGENG